MAVIELIKKEYGFANQERETSYNLSISEIYAMTLSPLELSKLGLKENILFNMLLSNKKLFGKRLSIAELARFDKPIKKNWKLKIRKDTFVSICKEMGKRKISKIIEDRNVYYMDDDFFAEHGLKEKDIFDMAASHFVLRVIKLNEDDLEKIGVSRRLIKKSEDPVITLSLKKYTEEVADIFQRAKRCPTKRRCENLFNRVNDSAYNRYTCFDCRLFKAEEILEKSGEFRDVGSISYGVSCYGQS